MNIDDLAVYFSHAHGGYTFDCLPMPGDMGVLQVTIEEMDEIPVFISITDTQVLCIAYLWRDMEVKAEKRVDMLESMLEMNIPIPLSSFAKIGDRYALFGALSINSHWDDVVHEVITLVDNAGEVLEVMEPFLA